MNWPLVLFGLLGGSLLSGIVVCQLRAIRALRAFENARDGARSMKSGLFGLTWLWSNAYTRWASDQRHFEMSERLVDVFGEPCDCSYCAKRRSTTGLRRVFG